MARWSRQRTISVSGSTPRRARSSASAAHRSDRAPSWSATLGPMTARRPWSAPATARALPGPSGSGTTSTAGRTSNRARNSGGTMGACAAPACAP
ncbi:hypothetical protein [Streptomyces sp. NPDC058694]|uniref:hypothetical protein n=1 Tax=Streptomyces sp. NPDC058694 TaxID=3346603 RepID=UPI003665E1FD